MSHISPLVIGKVEGGNFLAKDPAVYKAALHCHEGKYIEFQIVRHRQKRSLNQNAFYWGVVVPLVAEAIGESDPESVHEAMKAKLNYYMVTAKGRDIRVPMSTADLSTVDFEAYLERIRQWGARFFSLNIPLPNEVAA